MFNIKNKFNKKGQVIVIDIVYALVLIMFVLFLLYKLSEISIYKANSNNHLKELDSVGDSVLEKLISNPKINCYIKDNSNSFLLPNCVGNDSLITKENLNLPSNYRCKITGISTSCNDVVPGDPKQIYSVDFNIDTLSSREISKMNYLTNNMSFTTQEVELKVWKDE